MTYFKLYHELPDAAVFIRKKVFMEEQGFVDEFDETDKKAAHIVLFEEETPIATCRYFWDEHWQAYVVGRIAVLKEFRGRALGTAVLQKTEEEVQKRKGGKLFLAAQVRAKGFYEKQGYVTVGEEFLDEYCPHIWMYKKLEPAHPAAK